MPHPAAAQTANRRDMAEQPPQSDDGAAGAGIVRHDEKRKSTISSYLRGTNFRRSKTTSSVYGKERSSSTGTSSTH